LLLNLAQVLDEPTTELAAIIEPTALGRALANKHGVPLYKDVHDLLQSSTKVDGAIVATPTDTHVSLATEFLKAGISVLVEKPVAATSAEASKLVSLERSIASGGGQARVLVGQHKRFNPFIAAAKRVVDDHNLGRILAVHGFWCTKKDDAYFEGYGAWHSKQNTGGGPILSPYFQTKIGLDP
jgi:predicted dehydrogenase